jgi:hypothetical protein
MRLPLWIWVDVGRLLDQKFSESRASQAEPPVSARSANPPTEGRKAERLRAVESTE